MANATIDIKEDATPTKKLASQSFTRGVDTVHQEEVTIGDGATNGTVAAVKTAAPAVADPALVVRNIPSGVQSVDDNAASLTVDALDLDIRNLVPASDEVQARAKAQFDDVAPSLPAEDAYADLRITANRDLRVNLRNAAGTEIGTATTPIRTDPTGTTTQPVSGTVTSNVGTGTRPVAGDIAHDAVDSGNPVKVGGKASGALPVAVAAADRTDAYLDREGRQIVRPWGAGDWTSVHAPAANTRATTTRAAAAAGVRHVCTGITCVLAAGATAPTAVNLQVRVRDGISDTGTILWETTISLPATAGAMNGIARSGLFIRGTAATAMTLEFSAAGGANTIESVSMEGVDITEA